MRIGITPWDQSVRTASALATQATQAESLGYDSFWVPESHFGPHAIPEPLMLLAAVAAGTARILLGTTSFLLPLRNPVQAAEQVAVLDQLCNGRLILGVGRGYAPPTLRAFEVDPRDKRALFETRLRRMQRAWSGAPLDGEGEGAALKLDPLPVQQPHPPIWVAAFGPKALAQAGRLGLPYLASPVETLAGLVDNYAVHAAAVGAAGHRPPTEVPVMRTLFVTRNARETAALRERVHAEALRTGRLPAGARAEDWALIGEAGCVREQAAAYRERLGVTHLIVTRLRIAGIDRARLDEGVAAAREALA
ncbi:MAG: LLM class flavin-dependent oxidoreductase [Pseudomonadales bacterium]|nr:LLM class flavin-dependent oxidoreductase [Pseudomonadales bacterium]